MRREGNDCFFPRCDEGTIATAFLLPNAHKTPNKRISRVCIPCSMYLLYSPIRTYAMHTILTHPQMTQYTPMRNNKLNIKLLFTITMESDKQIGCIMWRISTNFLYLFDNLGAFCLFAHVEIYWNTQQAMCAIFGIEGWNSKI